MRRPLILENPARRSWFVLSTASSAGLFFAGLLLVDPAAPARIAAVRPADPPKKSAVFITPRDRIVEVPFERIIGSALEWLVRHQYEDGSWSGTSYNQLCDGKVCLGAGREEHSPAVTALAVLACWESGLMEKRPDLRRRATLGLDWLYNSFYGPQSRHQCYEKCMYAHALATLAFVRAYQVTWDPLHRHYALRALNFLLNARNPGAGWRYRPRGGENDLSVTGWAVAAVEAAREIDLPCDPRVDSDMIRWMDALTDPRDYRTGYLARNDGGWTIAGVNDRYDDHETGPAIALNIRLASGEPSTFAAVEGAARRLAADLPYASEDGGSVDYLYWYLGTAALRRHQAPAGTVWSSWYPGAALILARRQLSYRDGCYEGSWDPNDRWGCEGGRVYATAINALTLATIWKTLPPPPERED